MNGKVVVPTATPPVPELPEVAASTHWSQLIPRHNSPDPDMLEFDYDKERHFQSLFNNCFLRILSFRLHTKFNLKLFILKVRLSNVYTCKLNMYAWPTLLNPPNKI